MFNILIVDDSKVSRLLVKNILKQYNFKVFEAQDMMSVKNNIFSKEIGLDDIDLILLDINLNDGNGLELLSFLRDKYPKIPVIMISGEDRKDTILNSIKLGAKDYILKPFDKDTFLNKVKSALTFKKIGSTFKKELEALLKDILIEISRSIISKYPFTLLKITFENPEEVILKNCKEFLENSIREIDKLYLIGYGEIIILLPLTGKSDAEILLNSLKEKISALCSNFQSVVASFPDDVQISEKPDPQNRNQYRDELLKKLGLSISDDTR